MPWWLLPLIFTALTVVGELIRPKPKFENARPAGLGDFSFPTATEGRSVPLIWGTVRLKAPNVVWYGNLRQVAITEKVKTGIFSSTRITTGYRYKVGIQFALCRGPVDSCVGVRIHDKFADGGRTGAGAMSISAPTILGGEDFGAGGIESENAAWFYVGDTTQTADSYLSTQLSPAIVPGYRGTCYYIFQGLVGTSPSVQPWSFDLRRIPDGLELATAQPGDEVIDTSEANPMNVLYEIMTDTDWGLKIPAGSINVASFRAAAATLATELNGFSMVLDNEKEASEVVNEVLRQIDGALYFDRANGDWKMKLIRDDYVLASQPLFDETNILSLVDYSRTTWSETTNQVRLLFSDTDDNFKQAYALAQDMANVEIQGGNISAEVNYPGCKKRTLANQLVWRELATLAYPIAKHTISVNRKGFNLVPGDVYRWSNARLGIIELPMRITRIDYGTLTDGKIKITAAQDIFATPGAATFGDPTPTGWGGAEDDPVVVVAADTLTFEAPRQLVLQDPYAPDLNPRVWAGARDPGGGTVGFQCYSRAGTSRPLAGTFENDFSISSFLKTGTLNVALPAYEASEARPAAASIVVDNEDTLSSIRHLNFSFAGSFGRVNQLANIAYIDGEFIGFEDASYGSSQLTISGVYRGLFNTAPKAHAINTRVWFISEGGNLQERALAALEDEYDVKLRSRNQYELISEALTPTTEVSLNADRIYLVPLAPRDPVINGVYADITAVSMDVDYFTELGISSSDDSLGLEIGITPRAWRVDDILEDHNLDLSSPPWADDSPNFDYELVLDPSGTPAITAAVNVAGSGTSVADAYILRNAMIVALGANTAFPTDARLDVTAKHTPPEAGVELTNPVRMELEMAISSGLQSLDDLTFGGLTVNVPSPAVVVGQTGNLTFDIKTALPSSGIVESNVNGGGWITLVAASATTGVLAVTAADSVLIRFTQAPTVDQFFDITGSGGSTENGYGVLLA